MKLIKRFLSIKAYKHVLKVTQKYKYELENEHNMYPLRWITTFLTHWAQFILLVTRAALSLTITQYTKFSIICVVCKMYFILILFLNLNTENIEQLWSNIIIVSGHLVNVISVFILLLLWSPSTPEENV